MSLTTIYFTWCKQGPETNDALHKSSLQVIQDLLQTHYLPMCRLEEVNETNKNLSTIKFTTLVLSQGKKTVDVSILKKNMQTEKWDCNLLFYRRVRSLAGLKKGFILHMAEEENRNQFESFLPQKSVSC